MAMTLTSADAERQPVSERQIVIFSTQNFYVNITVPLLAHHLICIHVYTFVFSLTFHFSAEILFALLEDLTLNRLTLLSTAHIPLYVDFMRVSVCVVNVSKHNGAVMRRCDLSTFFIFQIFEILAFNFN